MHGSKYLHFGQFYIIMKYIVKDNNNFSIGKVMNFNTSTTEMQSIISTLNSKGKPKEIEVIKEPENMNANAASTLIHENSFINKQDSHILNFNSALALSQGIPESISIDSFGKIE